MNEEKPVAGIVSTGIYLPERTAEVSDLAREKGIDPGKLAKLGCERIHVAAPGEHPSDMAIRACREALERGRVRPEEIDLLVYCGGLKDYLRWQAASKVLYDLGATGAWGFDVFQGCNGQSLALGLVEGLIATDPAIDTVLIVSADLFGTCTEKHILDTTFVFGDGASAALVRRGHPRGVLLASAQKTYGKYNAIFGVEAGGTRLPVTPQAIAEGRHLFRKIRPPKGPVEIGEFVETVNRTAVEIFEKALGKAGLRREDVALLVTPNTSVHHNRLLLENLGLGHCRHTIDYVREVGHLGAADIFLNLHRAGEEGLAAEGDVVAVYTGGGNFTWTLALIRW